MTGAHKDARLWRALLGAEEFAGNYAHPRTSLCTLCRLRHSSTRAALGSDTFRQSSQCQDKRADRGPKNEVLHSTFGTAVPKTARLASTQRDFRTVRPTRTAAACTRDVSRKKQNYMYKKTRAKRSIRGGLDDATCRSPGSSVDSTPERPRAGAFSCLLRLKNCSQR